MKNTLTTRTTTLLASLAATTLLPALTLAAEQAGHEEVGAIPSVKQGVVTAITALIVFGIVAVVLHLKVWPVIGKALDERANKIKEEIDAAEMARQQAKDALDQYQSALAQARAEAQKEIDKARAQAQTIAAELKSKADAELAQMREKAMKDIENAKRAAVTEVSTHATNLAAAMAGRILRREVSAGDTQRLVEESLAQLAASRN